ncbi:TPD1 protein-like 1, partial [Mucuna pruriens]
MNHCFLFFLCFTIPIVVSHVEMHYSGSSTQTLHSLHEDKNGSIAVSVKAEHARSTSGKPLLHGYCTSRDISITQSVESATGIPQYVVQIENTCVSECAPYDIHIHCGWFASARVINPRLFKRLSYDDCLVNGGKPLGSSQIIRFTYSNSFLYPLAFKSATFCQVQK